MSLKLVDYSDIYYSGRNGSAPDEITGKFVQMRNNQTEYLVFAPKEFAAYHANIVERFCMDKGIKGSYRGEDKRFEIREKGWVIAGGGKFEIDKEKKVIRLYDNSMAYGRFDSKGLAEKIRGTGNFTDYQIMIY